MINDKLKQYLSDKGIKHSYIAGKINIPQNIFSYMINGKRKIKPEEFSKICDALGVSSEELRNYKPL